MVKRVSLLDCRRKLLLDAGFKKEELKTTKAVYCKLGHLLETMGRQKRCRICITNYWRERDKKRAREIQKTRGFERKDSNDESLGRFYIDTKADFKSIESVDV
jgi:hypothetical protein